jgi:hypothetical protein
VKYGDRDLFVPVLYLINLVQSAYSRVSLCSQLRLLDIVEIDLKESYKTN